jgi:hypothetical protein
VRFHRVFGYDAFFLTGSVSLLSISHSQLSPERMSMVKKLPHLLKLVDDCRKTIATSMFKASKH